MPIKVNKTITQSRLKDTYHYCHKSGCFTRISTGNILSGATFRLQLKVDNVSISANRAAFLYMKGKHPENVIDHINEDCTDNRWCNLRDITQSQNIQQSWFNRIRRGESIGHMHHTIKIYIPIIEVI